MTAFEVDDVEQEHERLKQQGVRFSSEPKQFGTEVMATLNDTCGNLIMIYHRGGS